ncbi:1-phosphofructokinase [Sporolactobacillus sp. CQH2019]|uniref:1-phosphofructokinase n=1 Tax=Sporolactobacillus sp. CQH2019 TaxID=3023512 RepID=UPI00236887F2|nr:1-phosphofructokinase [Sporolactobacillus sp. CQH2019]MDD9148952.1 1-phosphofructokinase [Sporolactobacillus sp. CQH2019]
MIYTCTMNPAIDSFSEFDEFKPFIVNRSKYEDYQANGKAINISLILKKMNIDSIATGFLGGFTGDFIEAALNKQNVGTKFIHTEGITRINSFIRAGNLEYKAVNHGSPISGRDQQKLLNFISSLQKNDLLFVSGSLPKNVKDEILIKIARFSREKGFSLVLDVSSGILLDCLPYGPELIKPSDEELASLLNSQQSTDHEVIQGAGKLLEMGAKRVIVSRGERGAIYRDHHHILSVNAPEGRVINTACSGDTMVAAFMGSLIQGKTVSDALAFASAAASSTAFTAGLSDLKDVPSLLKQIHIKTIKNESEV